MSLNLILLFLFAGVPYYLLFEKIIKIKPEKIFFLAVALIIIGVVIAHDYPIENSTPLLIVTLLSAIYSFHKASLTTNFYKFTYYMLFVNAPIFMMFDLHMSGTYYLSLIITLLGVYFIGRHYEQNYGSANYQPVTGIIVSTPFAGGFLTLYLITLALYPPFPNALIFLHTVVVADLSFWWYVTVLFIFFANFILAMRIMGKTVFGKTNDNVHYVELSSEEKTIHFLVFMLLFLLSIWDFLEFKEIFA